MNSESREISSLSITTLVMWVGCLIVGAAGYFIPAAPTACQRTAAGGGEDDSCGIERFGGDGATREGAATDEAPPPERDLPAAPAAPLMVAIVTPSSTIEFPQPTSAPVHLASPAVAPAPDVPRRIVFGQAEGRQPSPEYPREAILSRQQGTVLVRFTVGEDGRVEQAEAAGPCPFPLLNQAAVRSVRETWRFVAGPVRRFEVVIEYTLRRK